MYLSLKYTVKEAFPTISNNEESNEFRDFDKIAYFSLKYLKIFCTHKST